MSKPIYTNGAVAKLSAPLAATDLACVVDNGSKFPDPVSGESYWMTLVGNVSQNTEIVEVTSRNANTMTIVRAQGGTTAQAFNVQDQAYHALTAEDASRFRDAMYYYLGPKASEPTEGNYGEPLETGMLYFNTSVGEMREYNGANWQQFAALVSLGGLIEATWDAHNTVAALDPILWKPLSEGGPQSDNSNDPPEYSSSLVFNVYIGGVKLIPITEFTVAAAAGESYSEVTLVDGATGPFKLSISWADSVVGGYIPKDDENASDWAALGTQDDMNNGVVGKLAACDTAKVYADAGDAATQAASEAYADQVEVDANAYSDAAVAAALLAGPPIAASVSQSGNPVNVLLGVPARLTWPVTEFANGLTISPSLGVVIATRGWYRFWGMVTFKTDVQVDTNLDVYLVEGQVLANQRLHVQINFKNTDNNFFRNIPFDKTFLCEVGDEINVMAQNRKANDTIADNSESTFFQMEYRGDFTP